MVIVIELKSCAKKKFILITKIKVENAKNIAQFSVYPNFRKYLIALHAFLVFNKKYIHFVGKIEKEKINRSLKVKNSLSLFYIYSGDTTSLGTFRKSTSRSVLPL